MAIRAQIDAAALYRSTIECCINIIIVSYYANRTVSPMLGEYNADNTA